MNNQEAIAIIKKWVDEGKPAADPAMYPLGTVHYKYVVRNIPELAAERNKRDGVSVIEALEEAAANGEVFANRAGDFFFDKTVGDKLKSRY